jgi:hypothetical protein
MLPLYAIFAVLASPAQADPVRLLDASYTGKLCEAWNGTSLPAALGRSGSGWIDSAGSVGRQLIVISRRDCTDWPKVQLLIEADDAGQALCLGGGAFPGGELQWQFTPTTEQWADFTDGFGVMQMPGIMSGFVGPYGVAASNIGNFEVFFAAAGKLALDLDVDWTCAGADAEKVAGEVADIDREDMAEILR